MNEIKDKIILELETDYLIRLANNDDLKILYTYEEIIEKIKSL